MWFGVGFGDFDFTFLLAGLRVEAVNSAMVGFNAPQVVAIPGQTVRPVSRRGDAAQNLKTAVVYIYLINRG